MKRKVDPGISISSGTNCTEDEGIVVKGRFRVPYADNSLPDQVILFPKQITLVVTRCHNYKAVKPFTSVVIFEDDVQDDGEYGSGEFSLNVFDHVEIDGAGNYYILCSLGCYLSNILQVTVETIK